MKRLFMGLLFLVSAVCQAATYYVSSAGSDSNAGTSTGAPWQTISMVNTVGIQAGDSLYFHGGDTFSGNLDIAPSPAASSGSPIVIGSYGTGSATISCGNSWGVRITDSGYVTVQSIIVSGVAISYTGTFPDQTASITNPEGGILFYCTTASTAYPGCVVRNCEVSGASQGIYFRAINASVTVSYSGLLVENNYIHDCGDHGIYVTGRTVGNSDISGQFFSSPIIRNNIVTRIPGTATRGFTIRLFNASSGLIEGNALSYNGWASTGFPVSILIAYCTDAVARKNEVSYFYTHGGDGHGIDADINCTNTIVEYNYCHDSPYYGLFNYSGTGSVFRYNVVERCGGGINDNPGGTYYHNTLYSSASAPTISAPGGGNFYNNIIVATSGQKFADTGTAVFIGNTYQNLGGSSFVITINSTTYTSLSAMRTAGFEKVSSTNYGANGSAVFRSGGNGIQQLIYFPVAQLPAYDLGGGSAAVGVGIPLANVSITAPATDWHGNAASITTPDSGAVANGSAAGDYLVAGVR